jgi:transposase InsO family protein
VDFPDIPPIKHIRYLLVFIDILTGLIEAVPNATKRASIVATIIFRKIILVFSLPTSLQSVYGPEFTSTFIQQLTSYVGSKWHFYILYNPQSSGKVEKANHTLKNILTKLTQELQLNWIKLLLLALLCT